MSDHQALVEALLMKSILGQELIDTKFHLFSSRPPHPRKVSQLQALSANDVVLTARSVFLGELLSRTGPPDATFVDFDGSSAFEDGMALDDYGYASDSDLEDEEVETASQTLTNDKKDNILQELSSTFTSKLVISLSRLFTSSRDTRYPAILQMQVQVLIQHIASVPVIQNMPSLIRRIVDSQLPHGADIIIDLYQKFLLQYHPPALAPADPPKKEPSPQRGGFAFESSKAGVPDSVFGKSFFGQSAAAAPVKSAFGQSSSKGGNSKK
ncbi:hypothetical protein BDR03DRAFT_981933 [Suillus americanus]|nr:hypothetical protein BDR03DRAFT_981933 [Suillus americanus]